MTRKKLLLPLLLLAATAVADNGPKVTWHWHMHQPIYWNDQVAGGYRYEYAYDSIQAKAAGRAHPLNDLDEIFGKDDRVAAYQYRMADALALIGGTDPNSGASISYSGALIENIRSLAQHNTLGYGANWKSSYVSALNWTTTGGQKRFDMVNFSFHHGLLALLDPEVVYMELRLHQEILRQEYGSNAISSGFFPTEMCFSERLIPVLHRLGINWAIVSGEHIARACPDFPVIFGSGGINCDPPNRADQINPDGVSYIRASIDRGCSPVNANPLSFQPAWARYVDPETGVESRVIVVPADQAQGWKDGYSCLDAGFLDALTARNDPAQPSLVLLAHDGDNAFGGGYSYYNECVPNLAAGVRSRGREVTSIQQYLLQYPPPADHLVHVEDGGWVFADSDFGSPTFINWNYPLLDKAGNIDPVNGWNEKPRDMAIFTEALNRLLTAQQSTAHAPDFAAILNPVAATNAIDRAWHFYLGSLDSGNVYFGPALDNEVKATLGANRVFELVDGLLPTVANDHTPPTIWLPQRYPYNPGSTNFGVQYKYKQFVNNGDFYVYTFISDVSGPSAATLKYRIDADGMNLMSDDANETYAGGAGVGAWADVPMAGRDFPLGDPYGNPNIDFFVLPQHIARQYSAQVTGVRDALVDYYVEAHDAAGNVSRSPIQHVYIGSGQGAPTPSQSPTPTPLATASPTTTGTPGSTATASPSPTGNPFVMDGNVDSSACQIGDGLYAARADGWVYVAARLGDPNDSFVYLSGSPSALRPANWAKNGQVMGWAFFLAAEGSNQFAGWFDGSEALLSGANYPLARGVQYMEGAIPESLLGGSGSVYIAFGIYGNADGGALLVQVPPSVDSNGNIDASEFIQLAPGIDPCDLVSPTLSPSATPSATATVSPTPSATATSTPTASATASASPSISASPSASPSILPSATATATASATVSASPSPSTSFTPSATASPSVSPSATASPSQYGSIRDAILGRTSTEAAHDVTQDGLVDAADLSVAGS